MFSLNKNLVAGFSALCAGIAGPALEASAGSITQPGEIVGYSWAPLPEGIYFATTGSYGNARGTPYRAEEGVNVPLIAWSTPWTLYGGRIEAYAAVPSVALGIPGVAGTPGSYFGAIYNPYANIGMAWDLGHGFSLSGFVGAYAPVDNALGQDFWTFNSRTGVTWKGDDWTLTAHVVYGVTGNALSRGSSLTYSAQGQKISPDYVNLDMSALKGWGKWSFGPVAFGSWDVSNISYNPARYPYGRQMQFAVGGLVGYDFGPVTIQSYLTHDVASRNYIANAGTPLAHETYETRLFLRAIVPLWNPPAQAPVIAKY